MFDYSQTCSQLDVVPSLWTFARWIGHVVKAEPYGTVSRVSSCLVSEDEEEPLSIGELRVTRTLLLRSFIQDMQHSQCFSWLIWAEGGLDFELFIRWIPVRGLFRVLTFEPSSYFDYIPPEKILS
jgi:hypothetical protein